MATSVPARELIQTHSVQIDSTRFLLRLEGLAMAAVSAALYARLGAGWGWFALLWFAPDLSFAAYLRGAGWGARVYNAVHTYVTPATLGLMAFLLNAHASLVFALIWANHIGVDRLLGFGLKRPGSFRQTHLGAIARHIRRAMQAH